MARDQLVVEAELVRPTALGEQARRGADAAVGWLVAVVEQQPGQHLVAVQGPQRPVRPAQQPESSAIVELVEVGGIDARSASTVGDQVVGEGRQGGAQAPTRHAARSRRAGGRGSSLARIDRRRRGRPSRSRSTATRPPTVTTTGELRSRRADAAPASAQRLAQAVAQRRDPEVLLERAQRSGERLGHRARARTPGPPARAVAERRDRPALEQHQPAVGVDGPLDVLRTAERRAGVRARPREPAAQRRGRSAGGASVARLDAAGRAGERELRAVDLAAHEAVGAARHGGHDAAGRCGRSPGRRRTARRPSRLEERLHEHGHRARVAGPDAEPAPRRPRRGTPPSPRTSSTEREHAGHRRRGAVLHGATTSARPATGARSSDSCAHASWTPWRARDVAPAVDRAARARRGDARTRAASAGRRAGHGQGGGLGAGDGGLGGQLVIEIDDGRVEVDLRRRSGQRSGHGTEPQDFQRCSRSTGSPPVGESSVTDLDLLLLAIVPPLTAYRSAQVWKRRRAVPNSSLDGVRSSHARLAGVGVGGGGGGGTCAVSTTRRPAGAR